MRRRAGRFAPTSGRAVVSATGVSRPDHRGASAGRGDRRTDLRLKPGPGGAIAAGVLVCLAAAAVAQDPRRPGRVARVPAGVAAAQFRRESRVFRLHRGSAGWQLPCGRCEPGDGVFCLSRRDEKPLRRGHGLVPRPSARRASARPPLPAAWAFASRGCGWRPATKKAAPRAAFLIGNALLPQPWRALKRPLGLVDHVDPALAAHDAAIAMALLERAERVLDLHGLLLRRGAAMRPEISFWRGPP